MRRLVASLGDGHTVYVWNGAHSIRLPLELYWFNAGLFVTGVSDEYKEILGTRVVGIWSVTTDSA